MLNLPIYFLGASYYLHTRINGKQVKKSLRTSYKRVAIIRAIDLLTTMHKKPDLSNLSTYELDVSRGVAKSDGPDDHARMMDAIAALKALHSGQPMQTISVQASAALADDPTALKLDELLEKFFLLKSVQHGTMKSYRATASELAKFLKNPPITRITGSDITRFQEHLAKKGNVPAHDRQQNRCYLVHPKLCKNVGVHTRRQSGREPIVAVESTTQEKRMGNVRDGRDNSFPQ